ncbi:MAG: acyl-ACP--UDP-N-acetylglucosamine O-acyltransferase [Deferribacteres bacterium]|nr:acyl-ACP--UDP-N-acetylglucosamine O-acyltransferase [candidate division KSB1 bacterium]MCB9504149.1 acyl-ACP--UDP-N-acetylglucosamine O-acyltransferase [Deferribacteres bacterium]
MTSLHQTAIVHETAQIGENVTIGPYAVIEEDVIVGDGTTIASHACLTKGTRIGKDCRIFQGAVLGNVPQDLKFENEKTELFVGDRTTIREYVTLNRGTSDTCKTVVGSDCLLMAYAHVAHDCVIGDHVILANSVGIAGHVHVGDWASIGGLTGVHQFTHIGCHSFIGGLSRVTKDVPPYILAMGEPLRFAGLNRVGLQRRGFSSEQLQNLKNAYRILFQSKMNLSQALAKLPQEIEITEDVQRIIDLIKDSTRGVLR